MNDIVLELLNSLRSLFAAAPEFWSAIVGAIVGALAGGIIAYVMQVKALREGRRQRDEDHKRSRQALGTALLFKVIRIHTNFHGVHRYIEECVEEGAGKGDNPEPWQFLVPLAHTPDRVHFEPDEMGMLLSLKDDDVFDQILSLDEIHNRLIDLIGRLCEERIALTERLIPEAVDGKVFSGMLSKDEHMALRPTVLGVNSLFELTRTSAKQDLEQAGIALNNLANLLKEKLDLPHKVKFKVQPEDPPTAT